MTIPSDGERTRAELEKAAFGRTSTPDEITAADVALAQLVAGDAAIAAVTSAAVDSVHEVDSVPSSQSADLVGSGESVERPGDDIQNDDVETGSRRRRSLSPLLVIIGVAIGVVVGVFVAHSQDAVSDPDSVNAPGHSPSPAPTANATAALKSFLVSQTAADKTFPLLTYATTLDIQPTSVHRILTSSDGVTLWTAHSSTDICLIWTTEATGQAGGATGGASCATPVAFVNGGLTVSAGVESWSWNGRDFTTTVDR
jgi:hypothetical protein